MNFNLYDEEDANDFDVVIVGAGLTGLTTAYNILKRKPSLNVLIIEGTDKAGGRVLSQNYSETFYASLLQKHITRLIHTLNINTCSRQNIDWSGKKVFFTKNGPVEKLPALFAAEVRYFIQVIQKNSLNPCFKTYVRNKITHKLATTSVDQLLKRLVFFSNARSVCSSLIYSTCGMRDLRKLSALWMLVMLNGAGGLLNRLKFTMGDKSRYFVQGGMTQLTEELLNHILSKNGHIIYGEIVTNIQFSEDRAYCYTTRNCFKCDIVVIAVPPPEISHICIEPSLPEHVSRSQMLFLHSDNIFFNAFYKYPFWKDEYSGDVLATLDSNTILNIAYDATCNNSKRGIIAGCLNNTNIIPTTSKLLLFETLSQSFKNNEAKCCTSYKEHERSTDENIEIKLRSSWLMSVMQPCNIFYHVDHVNASIDRVFFAASEYATKWPGTIDGAIETGELTANLILLRVRPQTLEFADMITIQNEINVQKSLPIEVAIMQYFCLAMNMIILTSFLHIAYNK
ncbi:probable flavin-containing monoamine oxidase A [Polistes fuscatus]|uniref:probable flavin-containing monoamine oxidase A n=1 Tax=Polistes fuscatus TaxID=30207 RepID=UPI001CA9F347|nr:probable flavin-containing monoamine oxidase A [Polistes fuscatus]